MTSTLKKNHHSVALHQQLVDKKEFLKTLVNLSLRHACLKRSVTKRMKSLTL